MKSKISFFNKGILINDLKRFGWIGIVYTLVLFFIVPLQIIMYSSKLESLDQNYNLIKRIFLFRNGIHELFVLVVPVIAAIFLFRYLHVKKSTDMIHALPIKRENLYNNHILIGVVLLVVPVILTGFVAWILNLTLNLSDYYIFTDIIKWVGITCLMEIVIFLVCVFLGMMTGSSIVQGVLTYIILFLPVGLSMLLLENLDTFVYGFGYEYRIEDKIEKLSPLVRVFNIGYEKKLLSFQEVIAYTIICIVLYFLAKFLYSKRKLEAASQSIAFYKLHPIFKYGVTFCSMLVGGLYFWETQHNIYWTLFGYFVASLLGYFIAEIILKKSLRVFKNIKGYFIYAAVIIFILLGMNYDIIGYERYVPPLEEVESIYFGNSLYGYKIAEPVTVEFEQPMIKTNIYFEKENLKNIQNLHIQIINDKQKNKYNRNSNREAAFVYILKNGKEITREYSIKRENYAKYLKPIYESMEYKKMYYNVLNVPPFEIDKIIINPKGNISKKAVIVDPKEIKEALGILKNELKNKTYEQMIDRIEPWADIHFLLADDKKIRMTWQKSYKEFEKWLQEKGYLEKARIIPKDIAYAVVEKIEKNGNRVDNHVDIDKNENVKKLEIFDKEKIEICLRNCTDRWSNDDNYIIGFYSKEKTIILRGSFDKNNVPDFVVQYFQ